MMQSLMNLLINMYDNILEKIDISLFSTWYNFDS